jgi:hypothetical protein
MPGIGGGLCARGFGRLSTVEYTSREEFLGGRFSIMRTHMAEHLAVLRTHVRKEPLNRCDSASFRKLSGGALLSKEVCTTLS